MIWLLSCTPSVQEADTLIYNAHIRIDADTVVEQLIIKDGHVYALGDDAQKYTPQQEINMEGAILLPGFHDAHTHLLAGSFVMERLLLLGVSSMGNLKNKVQSYMLENPHEPWIIGFGWVYVQFDDPQGIVLDEITAEQPMALFDSSGHNLLVNTAALNLAGITAQTPDPEGGHIGRNADGQPNGLLQEAAIELISPMMLAAYNDDDFITPLKAELQKFAEVGISSISEILAVPGVSLAKPQLYTELYDSGELPLRVHYYLPLFYIDELEDVLALAVGHERPQVRFAGLKVWVDGSTSSGSAWSLEASVEDEDDFGSHYWDAQSLGLLVKEAEEQQFSIKFHANGDAAVRAVLDAIEAYGGHHNQSYLIEHGVLFDPEAYSQAHDLGVCLSVQSGIASLGRFSQQAQMWGEERMERAWQLSAFEQAGITTLLGTDWPVWPTVDPLINAWTATVGLGQAGLSPTQTLESYTLNVEKCLNIKEGCLQEGCRADYSIFDQDPYDTPPESWTDLHITDIILAD